jgi:hypothetical protein
MTDLHSSSRVDEALHALAEVPLDALRHMIYAYPTFHRGVQDARRDLS